MKYLDECLKKNIFALECMNYYSFKVVVLQLTTFWGFGSNRGTGNTSQFLQGWET